MEHLLQGLVPMCLVEGSRCDARVQVEPPCALFYSMLLESCQNQSANGTCQRQPISRRKRWRIDSRGFTRCVDELPVPSTALP